MTGKRWPRIRAGAIALAIVVGLIEGCPLPEPGYEAPWQQPIVDVVRRVQRVVLRPFMWIQRTLVVTQRWALFQVAARERYRLELQGRRGGDWELMFRAGDPDHAAYAGLLLDERVRGAWNPTDRTPLQFGPFAQWFLGHVLAEDAELSAARIRFERVVLEDGDVRGTREYVMPMERAR
ncbi:MAG: hypothetical protein H0T46_26925 [Deltaproteobacteria bacterium]|nr:hypothetical protein [Deltaproteobacteria bacterium]